ncbi:Cation/H+ exchanger [Zopfochytrium polystomum]|nr:Cation/H+ exchanger [Zopfochytrium polystomum]
MADHGADPGVGSQPWDALIIGDDSLKTAHTVYLFLGAFICLFGLVSLAIKEKLYMSEAMVAVLIGVVVGPFASKLFVPSQIFGQDLNKVTFELTRLVVAIQCMACGVDLPGNYLWREKRSVLVLLGPVMILMWIVTALGIYWIIGLSILDSLIIAACLTPTDPVLANSIVKGRFAEAHIPLNVRLILAAESGANDGLGTPFLFLAFYLQRKSDTGLAIGEWFARIFLYQVCLAVVFGALVAYLARKALKLAERNGWIDKESLISFTISLTLFIMGVCAFLGLDDILAVFIAGNTHFQEIIDALLNLAFFVYIGSLMPWSLFGSIPQLAVWRLVVLALWVLFLRRLPAVLAMYKWIPALKSPTEAIFAGVRHALYFLYTPTMS